MAPPTVFHFPLYQGRWGECLTAERTEQKIPDIFWTEPGVENRERTGVLRTESNWTEES